jgi:hypothetical protein
MKYIFAVLMLLSSLSNASTTWQAVLSGTNNTSTNGSGSISSIPELPISNGTGKTLVHGTNANGQLGTGTTTDVGDSYVYPIVSHQNPIPETNFQTCSMSYPLFTICVMNDGSIKSTGSNTYGQLGNGTTTNQTSFGDAPVVISGSTNSGFLKCSAGAGHSVCVKSDGTVWATGLNSYGQLGDGTTTNSKVFIQVFKNIGVSFNNCSANVNQTICVGVDGNAYGVGQNYMFSMGQGAPNTYTQTQATSLVIPIPKKLNLPSGQVLECFGIQPQYGSICSTTTGLYAVIPGQTTEINGKISYINNSLGSGSYLGFDFTPVVNTSGITNCSSSFFSGVTVESLYCWNKNWNRNLPYAGPISVWGDNSYGLLGTYISGQTSVSNFSQMMTTLNSSPTNTFNYCFGNICVSNGDPYISSFQAGYSKVQNFYSIYANLSGNFQKIIGTNVPKNITSGAGNGMSSIFISSTTQPQQGIINSIMGCDGTIPLGTNNGNLYACLSGIWIQLNEHN